MVVPYRHGLILAAVSWGFVLLLGFCRCQGDQQQQLGSDNSFLWSSVSYPERTLEPYGLHYVRVGLPPWFSSLVVNVASDIDVKAEKLLKLPTTILPVACLRIGGLPLPDASETSLSDIVLTFNLNGSFADISTRPSATQCFPFQRNLTIKLTNEQIPSGMLYIGYFNGLGAARTQGKMISRGNTHKFSSSINIGGCLTPSLWGPYCNQTINLLSCGQSESTLPARRALDTSMRERSEKTNYVLNEALPTLAYQLSMSEKNVSDSQRFNVNEDKYTRRKMLMASDVTVSCRDSVNTTCLGNDNVKIYSLDVTASTLSFSIIATGLISNGTSYANKTNSSDEIIIRCYARYNALPSKEVNDYFGEISHSPFVVQAPEIGRWYILLHAVNQTIVDGVTREVKLSDIICFSFEWQVLECPHGKAGPNCLWERHALQRIYRDGNPFEPYYLPVGDDSIKVSEFSLEPLLSNSSVDAKSNVAWTYFILDVPPGSGGSNLRIQITSDGIENYEVYLKFNGLPSISNWDYYVNSTSSNNSSMMLMPSESKNNIDFVIIYPKEGTWSCALKHPIDGQEQFHSTISISLQKCPRRCSSHGRCNTLLDESGMTAFSYCSCDRDHGGFDCSIELVSNRGHIWQSISLIASNGAAILPAFLALRRKALAEWVLFTCSGISSGLYHACDVGTWCPLGFGVLQFMDFWLSFMAVVSTFIYMATISESSKRAILTSFSIFTALLAIRGPTRSENIIIVVAIGTAGLFIGWMLEFLSSNRRIHTFTRCNIDIAEVWKNVKKWPRAAWDLLLTRFRWPFLLLGFVTLAAAGISWRLETNVSYWIWHSLWHITIYTSSFFFLLSISVNQLSIQPAYELTRQNSTSRDEPERHC